MKIFCVRHCCISDILTFLDRYKEVLRYTLKQYMEAVPVVGS